MTLQRELQFAVLKALGNIILGHPRTGVPQHNRSTAVLPLGDCAFEIAIVQRVILCPNSKALLSGIG